MTRKEASIIIGNIPINSCDCYTITEYQEAKAMAIKALEQEPCEDCISRQAAIRWVKAECNPYGKPTLDFESGKKVIKYLKKMQPITPWPKTGRWIPVSERLPEEQLIVIGTTRFYDIYKAILYDDCGKKKWYANGSYDVPIVAWMVLPEPYNAESEG